MAIQSRCQYHCPVSAVSRASDSQANILQWALVRIPPTAKAFSSLFNFFFSFFQRAFIVMTQFLYVNGNPLMKTWSCKQIADRFSREKYAPRCSQNASKPFLIFKFFWGRAPKPLFFSEKLVENSRIQEGEICPQMLSDCV